MSLIGKKLFVAVAPATIISLEVEAQIGVYADTLMPRYNMKLSGRNSIRGNYLFNATEDYSTRLNVYRPNVFSDYKLAREYLLEDLDNQIQSKQEELDELFNLITDVSAL